MIEEHAVGEKKLIGVYHTHSGRRLLSNQVPGPSAFDRLGEDILLPEMQNKIVEMPVGIVFEPAIDMENLRVEDIEIGIKPSDINVFTYVPDYSMNAGVISVSVESGMALLSKLRDVQIASSPVKDFRVLARKELDKIPARVAARIESVIKTIEEPLGKGRGRVIWSQWDGRLRNWLTELKATMAPLIENPSRDLTDEEIKSFIASTARMNDYQKTIVEPDARRGARGEKTRRQEIGGIVEIIREDVNNYLHKSGTLYHRMAQLEGTLLEKSIPKALSKTKTTWEWEYNEDDQLVKRTFIEIPVRDIGGVAHEDFTTRKYQEIIDNISARGYPGHFDEINRRMTFLIDVDPATSSPVASDQSRFDSMRTLDKLREQAGEREKSLADYEDDLAETLEEFEVKQVMENAREANIGPVRRFFNRVDSFLSELSGRITGLFGRDEKSVQEVAEKTKKASQAPPIEGQTVFESEIVPPPIVTPVAPVLLPAGTSSPVIAPPIIAPQVMSPVLILGKLESPFYLNDRGEIISRHAIDYSIDTAMARPGEPESRIPGRSGRDQQHHQKAVNATAANGPVSLPTSEPLPIPGSSGSRKAPISMVVMVRGHIGVEKDAIQASSPIIESLKRGVANLRDISKKTCMNFNSSGTSPTAW
ncbi:MAG: hypothetical protein KAR32_11790, partial [Candidatus Omnitrophica bacterium]|nr:hypothetical protein [Candidatus Omnitrophota bacterium]